MTKIKKKNYRFAVIIMMFLIILAGIYGLIWASFQIIKNHDESDVYVNKTVCENITERQIIQNAGYYGNKNYTFNYPIAPIEELSLNLIVEQKSKELICENKNNCMSERYVWDHDSLIYANYKYMGEQTKTYSLFGMQSVLPDEDIRVSGDSIKNLAMQKKMLKITFTAQIRISNFTTENVTKEICHDGL